MSRILFASCAIVLLLSVGYSRAADEPKKKKKDAAVITDVDELFKKLDEDKDSKVTLEEFKKAVDYIAKPPVKKNEPAPTPPDYEKVFKELDRNSDKALLADEFKGLPNLIPLKYEKKKK